MNLNMKNIKKFILEKLKVTPNARKYDLPTWEQFTDALDHFPGKVVDLANFCEDLEDAEIKDYPTFVKSDNKRYPESGHIMELHADYDTSRNQTVIIYFKYEKYPNFVTVRLLGKDYQILVDSIGEDLYVEIYNKLKEYYEKNKS